MRRQEVRFESQEETAKLTITKLDGTVVDALVPSEHLIRLRPYHWAYRGKSGIVNDYGVSLTQFMAEIYGYESKKFARKLNNNDYFPTNYATKLQNFHGKLNTKPPKHSRTFIYPDTYFPFKKYKTKFECESLQLNVWYMGIKTTSKVVILVNVCFRKYIPTDVKIVDGDLYRLDDVRLGTYLLEALGVEDMTTQSHHRTNMLDYRIDPSTSRYVATTYSFIRTHQGETADDVIIEVRNSPQECKQYPYHVYDYNQEPFRLPGGISAGDGWRIAFVIITRECWEKIIKIWYDASNKMWMCTIATEEHSLQVKRLSARMADLKVEDIHIAPRNNARYQKALDNSGDRGKYDRSRAKFENRGMHESGMSMFTKPKFIKRRKIVADINYFAPHLYGGVGVWCKDLRPQSLRIKGLKNASH